MSVEQREPAAYVKAEIASQPEVWRKAATLAKEKLAEGGVFPEKGARVAIVGCGTSWFIAQAYAAQRELLGQGETDAFVGSEYRLDRKYDLVILLSRSGTTTEILRLAKALPADQKTLSIVGDPETELPRLTTATVLMPWADEKSVVQTRFATSALALLRASLGEDLEPLAVACEKALGEELLPGALDRIQITFLGRGMAVGLANEAALKMREAAIAWSESYPAMDYRHGPMSITDENSLVVLLGEVPEEMPAEIEAKQGLVWQVPGEDPLVTLVRCQKLAIAIALKKGLDPDTPRNLTRSIILDK